MKTIMKFGSVLLLATLPLGANAHQVLTPSKPEHRWTGTVTAVDSQDKILTGKHWLVTRTFNIGQNCSITTVDNKEAPLADLRPGEKVIIHYQKAEGIRVADRIAEKALRYDGTVQSVDPKAALITMEEPPLYQPFHAPRTFRIAGDCKVILWNGHAGALADVQPGDRIRVVYELPGRAQVAYRLHEQTSSFEGVADAINLSGRTMKIKERSGEKEFALGNRCQVILEGDKRGHLNDLSPGQQYRFTYENVNGVDVLDRIAAMPGAKPAETASVR